MGTSAADFGDLQTKPENAYFPWNDSIRQAEKSKSHSFELWFFYNCTWEGVMSTLLLLELSVEWVFGATRLYWKRRFKSILLWSIGQQKMNYSSKKFFIWTNHPTRLLSGHFGYDVVFHDNTSSKFKFRS